MIFYWLCQKSHQHCYCVYNPNTQYVMEMRDILWLHHIYDGKKKNTDEVVVSPKVALPLMLE